MRIDIIINSIPLVLGDAVDAQDLAGAEFRKAGPLRRLIMNLPTGQTIYSAENCHVECFSDDFHLYPCTHKYLNRDRQWKTGATVYLADDRLMKVKFQVIDGQYAAANFLDRFQDTCNAVLGDPVESSRYRTRWCNGAAEVTSVLHQNRTNVDFLLEINPDS